MTPSPLPSTGPLTVRPTGEVGRGLKRPGVSCGAYAATEEEVIRFILPWPPSINHGGYWATNPRTHQVYLTPAAKQFKAEAGWLIRQQIAQWRKVQGQCGPFPLVGRLAMTITYHRGDKIAYDITGNYEKGIADVLQDCGVYVNDQQIDHFIQRRGAVQPHKGRVIVEIQEISER